jgi:hypothetical protein
MINSVIVISYDNDADLGSYFKECADYAVSFLKSPEITSLEITEINDSKCNQVYIDLMLIPVINRQNALVVIYAHGSAKAFLYNGTAFIDTSLSINNISNTVIYTNACSTGLEFGEKFSTSGGTFIGYSEDIQIPPAEECRKLFIECDNSGLYYLLYEKVKLCELRQKMRNKFDQCIDKVIYEYKQSSFYAICFENARDSLVVLGQDLNRTII